MLVIVQVITVMSSAGVAFDVVGSRLEVVSGQACLLEADRTGNCMYCAANWAAS
jgi:hypothetical protein